MVRRGTFLRRLATGSTAGRPKELIGAAIASRSAYARVGLYRTLHGEERWLRLLRLGNRSFHETIVRTTLTPSL